MFMTLTQFCSFLTTKVPLSTIIPNTYIQTFEIVLTLYSILYSFLVSFPYFRTMKAIPDSVKLGALQLLKSGLLTRAVAKHFGVNQLTIAHLRASNKDNIPTLPSGCKQKL